MCRKSGIFPRKSTLAPARRTVVRHRVAIANFHRKSAREIQKRENVQEERHLSAQIRICLKNRAKALFFCIEK